jgi:hypothetical protein
VTQESASITFQERYVGARVISIIIKGFGLAWLLAGAYATFKIRAALSSGGSGPNYLNLCTIGSGAITLLGAAVFGFFAYALDLLRGIWEATSGEYEELEQQSKQTFQKFGRSLY